MPRIREQAAEGILRWKAQLQAQQDSLNSDDSESGDSDEFDEEWGWQRAGYHPVLQTDTHRDEYDASGYILLVHPRKKHAVIVSFNHCSCKSTLEGIQRNWKRAAKWQGSYDELFALADAKLDAKAAKLGRKLSPKDFDYADWTQLYAAIDVWKQAGYPLWKGRSLTRFRRRFWDSYRTPVSCEVLRRHYAAARVQAAFRAWRLRARNQAAACIQAAFRGWRFRLRVLYNPDTDLGQRYLAARFARHCHSL